MDVCVCSVELDVTDFGEKSSDERGKNRVLMHGDEPIQTSESVQELLATQLSCKSASQLDLSQSDSCQSVD